MLSSRAWTAAAVLEKAQRGQANGQETARFGDECSSNVEIIYSTGAIAEGAGDVGYDTKIDIADIV